MKAWRGGLGSGHRSGFTLRREGETNFLEGLRSLCLDGSGRRAPGARTIPDLGGGETGGEPVMLSFCLLNSGDVEQVEGLPAERVPCWWRGTRLWWGGLFTDGGWFLVPLLAE